MIWEVNSMGIPDRLVWNGGGLREVEGRGMPGVAGKCVEIGRNTSRKGGILGFN